MNERIQELAEQAFDKANNGTISDIKIPKEFIEKFAELIIKECAAEADKQTIYCRGIPWGRWIKEHFGVK
jgi:hypothetical protein